MTQCTNSSASAGSFQPLFDGDKLVPFVHRSSLFLLLLKRKLEGASWPLFFRPGPPPRTGGLPNPGSRKRTKPTALIKYGYRLAASHLHRPVLKWHRQEHTAAADPGLGRHDSHCHNLGIAPFGKPVLQARNPLPPVPLCARLRCHCASAPVKHDAGTPGHRQKKSGF